MNWSDERYVKLFTRRTATTTLWPWQSRALFPWLMTAASGAGVVDTGKHGKAAALSAITLLPLEVVEPGLAALIEDGTVEHLQRGILLVNFLEAQESRATDKARKRAQRERDRDQAREVVETPVTRGHTESHGVTPSLAQPSSAQPSLAQVAGADAPLTPIDDSTYPPIAKPFAQRRRTKRAPKAEKPADPRHAPLVDQLVVASPGYGFAARDARAVSDLLIKGEPEEILTRWKRALGRSGYPVVRTLPELATHWQHFATDAAVSNVAKLNHPQPAATNFKSEDISEVF